MAKGERLDCPCSCKCGGNRDRSAPACWPCVNGLHHRCSRACRAYGPTDVEIPDRIRAAIGTRGVSPRRFAQTGIVPTRRACAGGRGSYA